MATPPLGVIPIADPSSFYEPAVPAGGTGNVQWYSFTLGETHWVNIDTSPSFGPPDTELVLYDGAGNVIEQNDDDPTSGAVTSRIVRQLTAGTYYICVGMYEITAAADCVASSDTVNAGGIALYVAYLPDPPTAEEITFPHESSESLTTNPKWFHFMVEEGQTLIATAPGCLLLLYRQDGSNSWDASETLSYNVVLGESGATEPVWLAITQIGGGLTDWGGDFYVEPDGVYGGPPIDVAVYIDGTPPVEPDPIQWYAHFPAVSGNWEALASTGAETSPYPADRYYGRSTVAGSSYVWTLDWQTTNGATTPAVIFPDGPDPSNIPAGDVNWAPGVSAESISSGAGYGELRLHCAVDGVPVPGYLWMAWTPNEPNYANLAWGYDAGDSITPDFWTGFINTFEIP